MTASSEIGKEGPDRRSGAERRRPSAVGTPMSWTPLHAEATGSPGPVRVLIVEDHLDSREALRALLEAFGYVVVLAANGKEAVEAALTTSPDLILMDIMMPVMDGLEATREIRKQPQFAKLPIIALTAKAMIDDREKSLEAGANDYIAKPIDVDKLLSLARVWIRK